MKSMLKNKNVIMWTILIGTVAFTENITSVSVMTWQFLAYLILYLPVTSLFIEVMEQRENLINESKLNEF